MFKVDVKIIETLSQIYDLFQLCIFYKNRKYDLEVFSGMFHNQSCLDIFVLLYTRKMLDQYESSPRY